MIYATEADLETFLGTDSPANGAKLLRDASALLEGLIVAPYVTKVDGEDTVREPYATALKNAVCAQVEWWLETGDETDATLRFDSMTFGKTTVSASGRRLAPRALDYLRSVNLTSAAVGVR